VTRARNPAWLVAAVGLVSVLGAWLLYALACGGLVGWLGTTNHGTLVDPPARLADQGVRAGAVAFDAGGVWWLVVVASECAIACEATLDDLLALHVLLNQDASRVRRALLARQTADSGLVERFPRLVMLSAEVGSLAEGVYIVDPLGNLVLRYPPQAPAADVLEDLKKLLRVSQIG
jgi:cytochrome oxidase Cu insertion factor (SCO1/SenC/PrrC family)